MSTRDDDPQSERDASIEEEALAALALALAPQRPSASLRQRLLARADGRDRFLPFLDRLASLFDLGERATQAVLDRVTGGEGWDELMPGVRFFDFDGGPAIGEAHGGLVRLAPGCIFPMHRHFGDEVALILHGELEDDAGHRYGAGDVVRSPDGSEHEIRNVGSDEAVYAAIVVGLQIVGSDDDDDDDD